MSELLLHVVDAAHPGPDGSSDPLTPGPGEPFLHLCTPEQLPAVLGRFFAGQQVRVLVVDPARLSSEVRWEDSYGHGAYPHLYGPLEAPAVRSSFLLGPGDDVSAALAQALEAARGEAARGEAARGKATR